MTTPIFLDLHIHTSENADKINENYDVKALINKIKKYNNNSNMLISLTDHNTINKKAYETLVSFDSINVLLGVELHIRNYSDAHPYHAHMFFNVKNIINSIDSINSILNTLYPVKMVTNNLDIPNLEKIIKSFDEYDFILLPHGGQNHSTFNKSIPQGRNFDSTLERTIYYNQFDGFTARSNEGIEETIDYFKKLNINEFVNLITGTDNYSSEIYPKPKAGAKASDFVPTWMLAEPSFNGLRLSLSESSRLIYSKTKPEISSQIIKSSKLVNDFLDIDITLFPGLNVIIGESSAGKSLLIDSLHKGIKGDFANSNYLEFSVSDIEIDNPQNFTPHYINQNYIVETINKKEIKDIEIIKSLFPSNEELKKEVQTKLQDLQTLISNLIINVEKIETYQLSLEKLPIFTELIYEEDIQVNPILPFVQAKDVLEKVTITKNEYDKHIKALDDIELLSKKNEFITDISTEIKVIKNAIVIAYQKSEVSKSTHDIITSLKETVDKELLENNGELERKKQQQESLLSAITSYISELKAYDENLSKLLKFDYKIETQKKKRDGHELSIINEIKITPNKIVEVINKFNKLKITKLSELKPTTLFEKNHSKQNPKVKSYSDLATKIYDEFSSANIEKYSICTRDDKDFDKLSPGWKTAILLDLIFDSTSDYAPLLIDQPEDNLASTYLNGDLIKSIHKAKKQRQIIIVSHNATIPMLGDAQNVIVCRNIEDKMVIRNAPLESEIDGIPVVDYVARLTDGGKTSIKKRFKKYNLKKYRGEKDEDNSK